MNLYLKSNLCAELLQQLCNGRSISEISEGLKLKLSSKLNKRFGSTALTTNGLAYRPVSYLLNRDAHDQNSLSSPHDEAGALSASITQANKGALFCLGQDYDEQLTALMVKHLNDDTGLDFGRVDAVRFGDIELLVFPTLDDFERSLLNVSWANNPLALVARFNPMQVSHFSSFQFRLCITNDGQVIYTGVCTALADANNIFACKFELGHKLRAITDSIEIEILGLRDDDAVTAGILCCRRKKYYLREIHSQSHVGGYKATPVKFDWLEKTVRSSESKRVKAALTIKYDFQMSGNQVGGRKEDPWVPINRKFASIFTRLHPLKSEGRFFLRWGQSDGEGRLQFVEWFKQLLGKYQQYQVVIFDPYFEDVGLALLLICAAEKAEYLVFRSLPRPTRIDKPMRRKSDNTARDGINNLLANCKQNRHLMKRFKLRIFGLKEGRLHDRYMLIMGVDKLPIAGFHLSNSFQKAAENYPMLVTPIPSDVLLNVERYKSELVQEAQDAKPDDETNNPAIETIFDSTAASSMPRRYERLRFFHKPQVGDVLGLWAEEKSLEGLSGNVLKERMTALGLLNDQSLAIDGMQGLCNFLNRPAGEFTKFTQTWEVLGEILAHSPTQDYQLRELKLERGILDYLARFLEISFNRALDEVDKELVTIEARFFREQIDHLLHSSYHLHHLFHPTKYTALTWSEYYTIKFLWWHDSKALLKISEIEMAMPVEIQGLDGIRLSLLSQIVSEISLSVEYGVSEIQRDLLVHSINGLLHWIGLNAIEMELEKPEGLATVLRWMADFSDSERVRTLGWMIHHAANNPQKTDIYKGLVEALHKTLPPVITADALKYLIDSMRGHMRHLA